MKIVYDISIRSNRPDYKIKARTCQGTRTSMGNNKVLFVLEQTRRWFARDHFEIQPGFTLQPEQDPNEYVVTEISYTDTRPFHTIVKTVQC